jgi:hypothetical protein
MLESSGVVPKLGSPVLIVNTVAWTSSADKDDGDDHEDDSGGKFQQSSPELFLSVTKGSEDVDNNNDSKEYLYIVSDEFIEDAECIDLR